MNVEEVEAAVEVCARREVVRVAAFWVEALVVDAGLVVVEIRDTRKRGRGRAGEEEEHRSMIEEVAWAGDRELGRTLELEANGLSVALGA